VKSAYQAKYTLYEKGYLHISSTQRTHYYGFKWTLTEGTNLQNRCGPKSGSKVHKSPQISIQIMHQKYKLPAVTHI